MLSFSLGVTRMGRSNNEYVRGTAVWCFVKKGKEKSGLRRNS